jgi:hypothetical protein
MRFASHYLLICQIKELCKFRMKICKTVNVPLVAASFTQLAFEDCNAKLIACFDEINLEVLGY